MPIHIGATELILVLFLIILFFGPGRISKIGGEAGKSISLFKKNLNNHTKDKK
jgi:TatA/E family protein of Tat protein translocase